MICNLVSFRFPNLDEKQKLYVHVLVAGMVMMVYTVGKLPVSQVSPEQVKTYMAQEGGKRRELLQKFLATCSAAKVDHEFNLLKPKAKARNDNIIDRASYIHICIG